MSAPSRWLNVMIDIETMGHGAGAPILAVGLVPFQVHPERCELAPAAEHVEIRCSLRAQVSFYDEEGTEHMNAVVDPDTVEWWLSQDKAAQAALLREPRHDHPARFLHAVAEAIRTINPRTDDLYVWAKPPQYDLVSLRGAMMRLGVGVPWSARNEQDGRTILRAARAAMQSGQDGWQEVLEVAPTLEHSAVADAVEQAEQVVRFYRRLYRR